MDGKLMKLTRRVFSGFLAWLMVNPWGCPPAFAKGNSDLRRVAEVKAAVLKLGTGRNARVLLKLRDHEHLAGYIQQTEEEGFSLRVFCFDKEIPVPYAQVQGLRGLDLGTGLEVSTGSGVSARAAAGLATANPCQVSVKTARSGEMKSDVIFGYVIPGAALVALFVGLGLALHSQRD